MKELIIAIIYALIYVFIIAPLAFAYCWSHKFNWQNIKKAYYLLFREKDE